MTDHTIEVDFKATASCSSVDISRDWAIIQRMALALCPPGTAIVAIPPIVLYEAQRCHVMVNAMREALVEEIAAATKLERVE